MDTNQVPKIVRRLQAAEGYIELNLPERALHELSVIEEQGPFEAAITLLRGEALKVQRHFPEAVEALKRAATMIPAPLNKRAWLSLSECYRSTGRPELAEIADLVVNGETAAEESPTVVRIAIVPLASVPQTLMAMFVGLFSDEDSNRGSKPGE